MNFHTKIFSLFTITFYTACDFLCSVTVVFVGSQSGNIPAATVLNTLINCILADPHLVSTCAAVQSSFHLRTALIWSLALTHNQHLCHTVRHAAVELLGYLLTAIPIALLFHAHLKNRCQVPVANCITDTNCHFVQAGSSTIIYCRERRVSFDLEKNSNFHVGWIKNIIFTKIKKYQSLLNCLTASPSVCFSSAELL